MSVSPRERSTRKSRKRETIALMVPRESGLRASPKAFWRLCQANPVLRLERTAKGEVIVMAPAGFDSGIRNSGLTAQLWNWNRATNLGVVVDSSGGFTLPNGAVRAADAGWITLERWSAVSTEDRIKFAPVCPASSFKLVLEPSVKDGDASEPVLVSSNIPLLMFVGPT